MSDNTEVTVESQASAEVQAKAESLGWIPPSRFKGDVEKFVDADQYIERGETLLPIVKATNRRLQDDLARVSAEGQATAAALKSAMEKLDTIEERHSVETQRAVEAARANLKRELVAASAAGDHEAIADLTEQMAQLNTAETGKSKVEPAKELPKQPAVDPELVEWQKENTWYGKDRRKTSLALGIAQEMRENGERSQGREFYDLVGKEVDKVLGGRTEPAPNKVEGGRNGTGDSGNRSGATGGKGYNSLPADAKAACDADIRKFVGAGKKYANESEYRANWANLYHSQG